jgi:hypothetical protein
LVPRIADVRTALIRGTPPNVRTQAGTAGPHG